MAGLSCAEETGEQSTTGVRLARQLLCIASRQLWPIVALVLFDFDDTSTQGLRLRHNATSSAIVNPELSAAGRRPIFCVIGGADT